MLSLFKSKPLVQTKSLPGSWRLLRQSLGQLRRHWRPLVGIVVIVAAPVSLLNASAAANPDSSLAAYGSLATVVMNAALIWSIVELHQGHPVTLQRAYYSGTAAFVRFTLVALVLALQLVPLAIGAVVYAYGTSGPAVATPPERLLLGLICLLLALPTLYWMSRSVFSLYIVQQAGMTPVRALRQSAAIVRGQTVAVARRLIVLAIIAVTALTLPALVLAVAVGPNQPAWLVALPQLAASLVLLPVTADYGYRLYLALVKSQNRQTNE
ncbi:MAG TPA: hypothetical protein VK963_01060 [Candidatus Saccharimonadales bacterium]|nr:hypothetical protein [Candidatus Saccharimonadales bacterium]